MARRTAAQPRGTCTAEGPVVPKEGCPRTLPAVVPSLGLARGVWAVTLGRVGDRWIRPPSGLQSAAGQHRTHDDRAGGVGEPPMRH